MKFTVNMLLTCIYIVTPVPAVMRTVSTVGRFLPRITYLSSYVFLRRPRSFTSRKLYVEVPFINTSEATKKAERPNRERQMYKCHEP